jgi:hypothetical protein
MSMEEPEPTGVLDGAIIPLKWIAEKVHFD